jgi:hypothetical protein
MMEQSAPFETITKLDAAERRLRAAIRMFFERRDMVAIHTLAAAALQVLDDLARKRGNIKRMYGQLHKRLQPEQKKEFLRRMREAQGFFKHADKDGPDKVLKFYPEATKFFLFEAAHLVFQITGRLPPENRALITWSVVTYPDLFDLDNAPYLQKIAQTLSEVLKPDDFEFILCVMDQLSVQAKQPSPLRLIKNPSTPLSHSSSTIFDRPVISRKFSP